MRAKSKTNFLECNSHIVHFRITNIDKFRWDGNGAQIRPNRNNKINMIGDAIPHHQIRHIKRWNKLCPNISSVQTSLNNRPSSFKSKFTFHRMLISVGILFIVICSIANGQQLPRLNVQKPGESQFTLIFAFQFLRIINKLKIPCAFLSVLFN